MGEGVGEGGGATDLEADECLLGEEDGDPESGLLDVLALEFVSQTGRLARHLSEGGECGDRGTPPLLRRSVHVDGGTERTGDLCGLLLEGHASEQIADSFHRGQGGVAVWQEVGHLR